MIEVKLDDEHDYTYEDIAKLIGRDVAYMYRLVNRRGLEILPPERQDGRQNIFTADTVRAFLDWYNEEFEFRESPGVDTSDYVTLEELSDLVNVDIPTIYYYRRRWGVLQPDAYIPSEKGRPRAGYKPETVDAFLEWRKSRPKSRRRKPEKEAA